MAEAVNILRKYWTLSRNNKPFNKLKPGGRTLQYLKSAAQVPQGVVDEGSTINFSLHGLEIHPEPRFE